MMELWSIGIDDISPCTRNEALVRRLQLGISRAMAAEGGIMSLFDLSMSLRVRDPGRRRVGETEKAWFWLQPISLHRFTLHTFRNERFYSANTFQWQK